MIILPLNVMTLFSFSGFMKMGIFLYLRSLCNHTSVAYKTAMLLSSNRKYIFVYDHPVLVSISYQILNPMC